MNCLDTLGTLLAGAAVLAFAAISLFKFGSRIGVWFSKLAAENRKLYWAAVGMVCWTVVVAGVAWGASVLVYLTYFQEQPATPSDWAGAASFALLVAAPIVGVLAGLPWLVLVVLVRAVRTLHDLKALTAEGDEQPLAAWLAGDPSPTNRLARFAVSRLGILKGEAAGGGDREHEAPAVEGDEGSGKATDSST